MTQRSQEVLEEIRRYQELFPRTVSVHTVRTEEGNLHAEVTSIPGVITQARDFRELVDMVNDAILAYFEVPDEYAAFMPSYSPPIQLAIDLDFMPGADKEIELTLAQPHEAALG